MEDQVSKEMEELRKWMREHEAEDRNNFHTLGLKIENLPSEKQIDEIVRKAFYETLLGAGRTTKGAITTAAVIIVGLGIISGGFKWLLNFVGFSIIRQ